LRLDGAEDVRASAYVQNLPLRIPHVGGIDMTLPQPQSDLPRSPRQHFPALDGIRGVAIAVVMIYHLDLKTFLPVVSNVGWIGVDLFFVLSGFLITGILFDGRDDQRYFRNFYARRTLRIFPLYYAVLAGYTVLCLWRHNMQIAGELAWLWPYMGNVRMAITHQWMSRWLNHFWSLSVEEHYYLVWPAIVLWLDRKSIMRLCVGMMFVAFVLRVALVRMHDPLSAFILTPCRMDALAAGSWLALAMRGPVDLKMFCRTGLIVFAASAAILIAMYAPTDHLLDLDPWVQTFGFTLLAAASTGLIAVTVADPASWLCQCLSISPLRWLGKYSYAIYVLHPLFIFTPIVSHGWPPRLAFIPQVVASLLAAWLSWHLYEKHFLKLKRFFVARPRTPTPIIAAAPAQNLQTAAT
jgi:peptidoglycan/LPS O-acetylase OafA/YrhL